MSKTININEATPEELIRETYRKVEKIESRLDGVCETQVDQRVELSVLATKQKMYSGLFGSLAGIVSSLVVGVIMSFIKLKS